MVTSGEDPQTGEVQHYLASTWVPQTGSVWWRGREHHPATGWLLHHVRRGRYPTEPCGGKGRGPPVCPGNLLPRLQCRCKEEGRSPGTTDISRKNRPHRKRREKSPLFHPSLALLSHKPQHLLFIFPWPHCHCPFSWGEHCSWRTQQSRRDVLHVWLPALPTAFR